MAFNKAIERIRKHFGLVEISDWNDVQPSWILNLDGVGPATLDHVRIYLAMKGQTLKDDQTPEYWKENLSESRIGGVLTESDLRVSVPFTVIIDTREQQPFCFDNITPDVSETPADIRQMILNEECEAADIKFAVPTKFETLGDMQGDYSVDGFAGRCNVERKSMDDAHGTILAYGDRQQRFETELENLAAMEAAAVVIECSFGRLISSAPSYGKKTRGENKKILHRRVLSWQQRFRVPWFFCDNRPFAEVTTFRILQRFVKKIRQSNRDASQASQDDIESNLPPDLTAEIKEL